MPKKVGLSGPPDPSFYHLAAQLWWCTWHSWRTKFYLNCQSTAWQQLCTLLLVPLTSKWGNVPLHLQVQLYCEGWLKYQLAPNKRLRAYIESSSAYRRTAASAPVTPNYRLWTPWIWSSPIKWGNKHSWNQKLQERVIWFASNLVSLAPILPWQAIINGGLFGRFDVLTYASRRLSRQEKIDTWLFSFLEIKHEVTTHGQNEHILHCPHFMGPPCPQW